MNSPASKVSGQVPGGPPGDFQEWDGNHIFRGNGEARETSYSQAEYYISLPSIYGGSDLPLFGPQYGSSSNSLPQQSGGLVTRPQIHTGTPRSETQKLHEAQSTPRNLSLRSSSTNETISSTPQNIVEGPLPTSCIICTEDFSSAIGRPPWISSSCLHHPSVCYSCLEISIKSDLDNKIWNQIKCPECSITLIYDDILRLADPDTFARYDTLSFRSAVGADSNFIWCRNCDFGQLHASGELHPIVRCLKCGFRSCFKHSVPWHDRLTCDEYDEMLRDPDGFQSAIDRDDEAAREAKRRQEEEDETLARDIDQRERLAEQDRQRRIHEEQLRKARLEQEAEARRMKEELERVKKIEAIKRKQREDTLSLQTVQATTKLCPGCQWPIEKNKGCAHMTCIKCRAEFCWVCLNDYNEIRRHGNSKHKKTCTFHTSNLP